MSMKACFMGLGYIGLPTSIIAAKHGVQVLGVDINPKVVDMTNQGRLHIIEPGLEDMLQENGKEQRSKTQFDGYQQGEILQHKTLGNQYRQQVQRRGQVVGDQTQIVQTHADAPGIEQTLTGAKGISEFYKEGIVLMIHIRIQHGIRPEGLVTADEHDKQHSDERKQKRQRQRIPFDIVFMQQVHEVSP